MMQTHNMPFLMFLYSLIPGTSYMVWELTAGIEMCGPDFQFQKHHHIPSEACSSLTLMFLYPLILGVSLCDEHKLLEWNPQALDSLY